MKTPTITATGFLGLSLNFGKWSEPLTVLPVSFIEAAQAAIEGSPLTTTSVPIDQRLFDFQIEGAKTSGTIYQADCGDAQDNWIVVQANHPDHRPANRDTSVGPIKPAFLARFEIGELQEIIRQLKEAF